MRSRIINWSLALVAVLLLPQVSKAQIAASNPLEWIALAEEQAHTLQMNL